MRNAHSQGRAGAIVLSWGLNEIRKCLEAEPDTYAIKIFNIIIITSSSSTITGSTERICFFFWSLEMKLMFVSEKSKYCKVLQTEAFVPEGLVLLWGHH